VLETDDLDLTKEHACDDTEEPRQDPIRHRSIVAPDLVRDESVSGSRVREREAPPRRAPRSER
jgi:hypothetical protein